MSIKTHAQVISVFSLVTALISGITMLGIYAVESGHSNYIWYTLGFLWIYWVFRPIYLIMYDHFENRQK